jgi:hypothetical protein
VTADNRGYNQRRHPQHDPLITLARDRTPVTVDGTTTAILIGARTSWVTIQDPASGRKTTIRRQRISLGAAT